MSIFFPQPNLRNLANEYRQRYVGIAAGFYVKSIEELMRAGDRSTLVLANLDLMGIDLSHANLSEFTFYKCKFIDANFSGANLSGAKFVDCNFTIARMDDITVNAATIFQACNFSNASVARHVKKRNVNDNVFERLAKRIFSH